VTSGDAPAACLGLEIIDRYIDRPEHEALAEMVVLVGGVDIVAGTAGPPLFLVNMQVMEVDVHIPETGYSTRLLLGHHRLLVAVETEVVFALLILGIELMRERKTEDEWVIRTMRVVAGAAVALHDRAVLEPLFFPEFFILVTLETEIVDLILQQILIARIMGRVALNAFTLIRGLMFFGVLVDLITLPLMAVEAEFVRLRLQAEAIRAGMGIMTVSTARLDKWLMHKLLCHARDHIIMADKAEIGAALNKPRLVVRRMHIMAKPAVSVLYRLMYRIPSVETLHLVARIAKTAVRFG